MSKSRSRIQREAKTVQAMVRLYCQDQHDTSSHLCADCRELERYALARLSRCTFQENKPTCARCPIHCYRPDMREKMRGVMRYAGPRMIYRHPILALQHLRDGLCKAPASRGRTASPAREDKRDV